MATPSGRRTYPAMVRLDVVAGLATAIGTALADPVRDLEIKGRVQLDALIAKSETCSQEKLLVRKEWGDVPPDERRAYIAAVQCLMELPPKSDPVQFPGAKTRFDDFTAVHSHQTLTVHSTVGLG